MSVDPTALQEVTKKTLEDTQEKINAALTLRQAFNTTTTTKNASITLFALDAVGGPIKDIKIEFYLAADAAATFTPAFYGTRAGDPVTFTVRNIPAIAAIATPGANARYFYEFGDLGEGMQMEFRVAQDNNGAATVAIDGVLTYLA